MIDSNKRKILDDFANSIFTSVQENIPKDSNSIIIPSKAIGFPVSGKLPVVIELSLGEGDYKVMLLKELGKKCYKDKLHQIALFNNTTMKTYREKPEHATEMSFTHPHNLKEDCLTVTYIDFTDHKDNFFEAHPYEVNLNKIIRKDTVYFKEGVLAMDSLLMSSISFGFLKSALADEFLKNGIADTSFKKETGDNLLREVLNNFPGAALGMPLLEGE